jgi:hypothetical protein
MSKPYVMHRADPTDLADVMALLNERRRWLLARGNEQWTVGRALEPRMVEAVDRRETWLLRDKDTPIATLTVTSEGDPDFWTPAELRESALYLGKMATMVHRSGEGLGCLMISWARDWAFQSGFDLLRWDVWRTNQQLQDYYRSVGARHLRTVEAAERWSGALFEIPAQRIHDLSNHLVTEQDLGSTKSRASSGDD